MNGRPVRADRYLDRLFKEYGPFLQMMDIPSDVFEVFKLMKLGWNGAGIIRRACQRHQRAHPRIWRRLFAEEYAEAVDALLNGETITTFARMLGTRPPGTKGVKLGGKE